ncbi:MAG: adenylate/guanylate cyclase domain-containing protein [Deltaproteobacteria bacterium]|nr:adenylate/guanylate cyclase domain-containing protein [Deltaproteobacteria bacterium]
MISRLVKPVFLGLLTGVVGLGLCLFSAGPNLEEGIGLDILFKLRGERRAPPEVLIVSVDKESSDHLNLPDDLRKWPRSLHARLTDSLAGKGASVIAFDLFFEEARSLRDDLRFADSIDRASNVVLCERMKKDDVPLTDREGIPRGNVKVAKLAPPIPALAKAAVALSPYPLPKVPVKVSEDWTFETGAADTPTLPVVALQLFAMPVYEDFLRLLERVDPDRAARLPRDGKGIVAARSVEKLVRDIREVFEGRPRLAERMLAELEASGTFSGDAGKRRTLRSLIRMYEGGSRKHLNFYGPPRTIVTVPYYKLVKIEQGHGGGVLPVDVRGKAVFVGSSELLLHEQKDGFHTVFTQSNGLDLSGVEIAATSFANLLEDMPVRPLGPRTHLAVVFLWGVAIGVVCGLFHPLLSAAGVLTLGALYLFVAKHQFAAAGSWHPIVLPLFFQAPLAFFGSIVAKYVDSNRERRNIRRAFGYYLPDAVVDELVVNFAEVESSNRLVYGICLGTDAEQYTSLSEITTPKELGRLMNNYYEAIFHPVKAHGGIVSNVVGDSMLAIWVSARPDPALREKACLAALDIADAIERFNRSTGFRDLPTRIGLHSGLILLGNIGAVDHYEYRPVGDIVNTAARIEGLNKYLGTRVLVSGDVIERLEGFLTREIGEFLFLGKSKSLVVHELVSRLEESDEQHRKACAMYAEGLDAFRRQSWDEAIRKFRETADSFGQDRPSHFFLNLCTHYRKNPPGAPWDGVVRMDRK